MLFKTLMLWAAVSCTLHAAESKNMSLVGHNDLQGRGAYHSEHIQQGNRLIVYVGHHGGYAINTLNGQREPNGTSIVDVTDPKNMRYLAHIPGQRMEDGLGADPGGAQMVRLMAGKDLPKGDPTKTYLLRTFADAGQEIWDVTDPAKPKIVTTIITGLKGTHKNFWESGTGIAYLICDGRPDGWRANRMCKIYDLSDPTQPKFIRNFGLVGQEPGSKIEPIPIGMHGPIVLGNRVYFGYGTRINGVIQIVDREKLLKGDPSVADRFASTATNLLYPQISRLDLPSVWGAHTTFPLLGVTIPEYSMYSKSKRDFLVVPGEETMDNCTQPFHHMVFFVDITEETKPFPVSNFHVDAGNSCTTGGRFGSHAVNENFSEKAYYKKLTFVSYFNAGVRAVDVRDPFTPKEVGFYIPTPMNDKTPIQTNNVDVDDRGLIHIVDRRGAGLDILELTGDAKRVAE